MGLTVAWLGTRRFRGNHLPRVKVPVRVLFVSLGDHGDVVSWSAACHWLPTFPVLLFASVIRPCAALSSQHALITNKEGLITHRQPFGKAGGAVEVKGSEMWA